MMTTIDRARAYIAACPPAISGQGGHNQTFAVACILVHGFALPDTDAYQLLSEYNMGCQPQWTEKELVHKIKTAVTASHSKPRGHLLGSSGYVKSDVDYYKPPAAKLTTTKETAKRYNPQNRVPLPDPLDDSCRRFLLAAFQEGESISMADAKFNEENRSIPDGGGRVLTRTEWIKILDSYEGDPNKLFTNQKCGAFIRVNPTMGKADKDVTAFRHALIEFDQLSIEDQFSIISQSNLPCTAILHSGGKSIHAWARIDAKDKEEWGSRVLWLYDHFKQYGIDPKNKNPSRFSRLPGMNRGEHSQKLLALNVGAESWLEWQSQKEQEVLGEIVTINDILAYDPNNDPSSVLGKRWLCRGGSCVVVGQSGIGKSSLAAQAAMRWAARMDFFGVRSTFNKPLKSLIVQAENDLGDVAEMIQGVELSIGDGLSGDELRAAAENIRKNIVFVRNQVHTGHEFVNTLRRLIEIHKPDLVWIDPLLAFFGDDISNQKACSQFLRNWLNPILESSGVVLMLMHHTNKPDKDSKSKASWTRNDYSYAGSGSAELTNWARAVVVLRQHNDELFKLAFTKRGKRAGAVDLDGVFTSDVWLSHAERGIYWVQQPAPPEDEKKACRPKTEINRGLIQECVPDWMDKTQIYAAISNALGLKERQLRARWNEISAYLDQNTIGYTIKFKAKQ